MKKQRFIFLLGLFIVFSIFYGMTDSQADKSGVENTLEEIILDENIKEESQRSLLRAFYTAPPVIPHKVTGREAKNCLACHTAVTHLEDGRISMPTPHSQFSNCQQCHVAKDLGNEYKVETDWKGLTEPQYGDRWFATTPPTIPHRLFLRENCLACHTGEHPNMKMRSPHPQRTSCLQCHVPNKDKEF